MLWQASKFTNINGGFAGLVLLGYYNAFIGFCDIVPQHGKGAYPKEKCKALLSNFRKRYPKVCWHSISMRTRTDQNLQSRLWIIEEARMLAAERELDKAMEVLKHAEESPLKQVMALQWFERSLDHMYLHQYEECAEGFLKVRSKGTMKLQNLLICLVH
jgi:hypothetical protein